MANTTKCWKNGNINNLYKENILQFYRFSANVKIVQSMFVILKKRQKKNYSDLFSSQYQYYFSATMNK